MESFTIIVLAYLLFWKRKKNF
ncbi:MAG: hypothetical protein EAZ85_11470 [Bacteroidetes bacterium]|nr:MAG: hypothetical protein EAZ85_11470 [Bacteroidota bacterium]TAG87996.1 MAG: hypothetical protein EAZ20_09470 [Bacteroidota bacterium]